MATATKKAAPKKAAKKAVKKAAPKKAVKKAAPKKAVKKAAPKKAVKKAAPKKKEFSPVRDREMRGSSDPRILLFTSPSVHRRHETTASFQFVGRKSKACSPPLHGVQQNSDHNER